MLVVIQSSLRQESRTALVVQAAVRFLKEQDVEFELVDLRDLDLQFCDGRPTDAYNEDMQRVYKLLEKATGYIIGMQVYQYSVAGPLKNFLDIMAGAMHYKAFGVICNSGGIRSYLAPAELMKLLSYEAWCIPVQPTIHTWTKDFADGKIVNEKALAKLPLLIENVRKYAAVDAARP